MKDQHLNKIKFFLRNKKGSVTIEFFFMVLLLGILFAFMADLVLLRSAQGKLDNASFSLVNILRERTQLYGGRTTITDEDLQQFRQLAKLVLFDDVNSAKRVDIVLERWWEENKKDMTETKGDISSCPPYQKISNLRDLSPYSEGFQRERKVPLYQVTICAELGGSLFRAIMLEDSAKTDLGTIRSSTFAVSR